MKMGLVWNNEKQSVKWKFFSSQFVVDRRKNFQKVYLTQILFATDSTIFEHHTIKKYWRETHIFVKNFLKEYLVGKKESAPLPGIFHFWSPHLMSICIQKGNESICACVCEILVNSCRKAYHVKPRKFLTTPRILREQYYTAARDSSFSIVSLKNSQMMNNK